MTIKVENVRFRVRGGTAANLAAVNEVPLVRELVVETDTGRMKLGNGTSAYSALPYLTTGGVDVEFRVDSGFIQVSVDGGTTWENLVELETLRGEQGPAGAAGEPGAPGAPGAPGVPGPSSTTFPTAAFDGGLGDIEVGSFCDLPIPFGFEINRWTLVANTTGNLQVDVRVAPFSSHPPAAGDSICGSARPTLAGVSKGQDDVLAGWGTTVGAGSVMRFSITACSGIRRATLVLEGVRA